MIALRFACGHQGSVGISQVNDPVCPVCGETQIRAVHTRAPKFRGACSGPYAETAHLDPGVVNVAPKGPLRLKAQES